MRRVLETEGFVTEVFSTAEAFLAAGSASRAQCLVLDIHLPGMSGLELQRHLLATGRALPAVFVTGRPGEATNRVLLKPFPAEALIRAVYQSIHSGDLQ